MLLAPSGKPRAEVAVAKLAHEPEVHGVCAVLGQSYARQAQAFGGDEERRTAHARRVARLQARLERQNEENEDMKKWPL